MSAATDLRSPLKNRGHASGLRPQFEERVAFPATWCASRRAGQSVFGSGFTALFSLLLAVLLIAPAWAQGPQLPDLKNTTLEISWQDFKALVEASRTAAIPTPTPPKAAFLRSAEYRGRLQGTILRLNGTLELEVLASGWVRLPMWNQATVISFEGGEALLSPSGAGTEVMVQGPGTFELIVELVIAAPDHPGDNHLDLILPDAPLNVVEIVTGDDIENLEAKNALLVSQQRNRSFFSLKQGRASLSWRRPFEAEGGAGGEVITPEARVHLTSYQMLEVGEGALGGLLVLDYRIRAAEIASADIKMPDGIEVFEVSAPGLESWKVLRRDADRILHLVFGGPVGGDLRVSIGFEGAYDPQEVLIAAPRFKALGIERETGWLTVSAGGAEVSLKLGDGVLPSDPSELPVDILQLGGNPVAACKFSGVPGEIRLGIREHEDAPVLTAVIETLNATTLLLEDGTEALWMDLRIKNNRRQFLRLDLAHEQTEIWSLLVESEPARPKRSDSTILIPLPRGGQEVSSTISLVLLNRGPALRNFRAVKPSLPHFDVPVIEALWTVFLPSDHRYQTLDSPFATVSESHPVISRSRLGTTVLGAGVTSRDYASAPVSGELKKMQAAKEETIMAQVQSRQNVLRRGALPVRIALPAGVRSLPSVRAARILMVDPEAPSLPIRLWPSWAKTFLTSFNLLLVATAGILLGLWSKVGRRYLNLAIGGLVLSLIVPGGPGFGASIFSTAFIALCLWTGLRIIRWIKKRRTLKEESPD